ncbi:MAG: TonB-dependent receptor [Candidatus Acidiferrales bacterium]
MQLTILFVAALSFCFAFGGAAVAQTTVSTGSISGTVTDPSGEAVPNATIVVTNKETNQALNLTSTSSGAYNSGPLSPGNYVVQVQAAGFSTTKSTVVVQVGSITTGNVKLQVGRASTVVEVTSGTEQVNTEQATVQGVLTAKQISELPVNGRNFLDLATLEPGVQIQDGSTFDPTKNGFSSVSFGGRFGRTARIELDGVDISDETVGTTTQNIPQSSIQEFEVSQSSLDLSTELTSSGTINVITKSGTNALHGEAFYYGRSDQTSARIAPEQLNFGRKQFGGDLGGPILKNKLFFFGDVERTDQSLQDPVSLGAPFSTLSGSFAAPFVEREYVGKVDWNIKSGVTAFYRFSYDQNQSNRGFNPGVYQPFINVDHTPSHALGLDLSTGRFTHSIRFEYLKFRNAIGDASASTGAFNLAPQIALIISPGFDVTCLGGGEEFCSGPNILAPQATYQSDKQIKYDGSYTFGNHTLRYGVAFNKILGGGFANFFGLGAAVDSIFIPSGQPGSSVDFANNSCGTGTPCFPGGASNPLNYPASTVILGNGQGFFTETPGFGLPAGGQHDNRFEAYVGDSWKARPNLTITYGLHYGRDTGRTDSDLPPLPILDTIMPGLGNRVNQPNKNFGPQLGIAWDPTGSGKTVIRAGSGIYYENAIFNNVLFDRPPRLATGLFNATAAACFLGSTVPVTFPNGSTQTPTFCGQPIGSVASQIATFQQQFDAATAAVGASAPNPNFFPNTGVAAPNFNGLSFLAPNYRSPYSIQMNVGVQHQFGTGTVLSVDYVRNVGLHYTVGIDVNHTGDARFLNQANALAAISATNNSFGCGTGTDAASINCSIGAGASISDFAVNGLDSTGDTTGGSPCGSCAFPGINPAFGNVTVLAPEGRSVYNGLLVSLTSNLKNPMPGMRALSLITSYSLSRFKSLFSDQDFVNTATDYNNPLHFFGPTGLDRTHQVGVGAVMDLPFATRFALSSTWKTAIPLTLFLPNSGLPGEIFRSDVTGDGTVGDVLPGTNVGTFGRTVKAGGLNGLISNYNSTAAGKITPAGQALVTAGLFSQAQLVSLGAVTPTVALAPAGNVGVSPLFTFDAHISWLLRPSKVFHAFPERVIIEPQIALFNVFNFHNYDPGGNVLSGILGGGIGQVNGTTAHGPLGRTNLITPGAASGVNWYAVPRQAEFGAKVTF